ncbi:glycosyltransferase family 4 protein [uncultured Flavobacterium sp.]|uniref:glycosyltransferase family 4 protein n=1 Tax=uncultured Flavobacterium sp. TaxID=165435 RepID=UPI0025F887D6|nr:glycosyltransferase family 4 protein [uncultured Flavobacterium sp.]
MEKITDRKIVVINQAVNYLTIGFCNAFYEKFESVTLVTGNIHSQGEELAEGIDVVYINKWVERPAKKKLLSYIKACWTLYRLLKTKYKGHEVFFVSLPPMAYLLNLLVKNRFSMIIWDVYPDVFKITGMKESHPIYSKWAKLNKKSFKKAYKLFTISEKMAELIEQYVESSKIIVQPIWSIFQENKRPSREENPFIKEHNLENKFVVQYSGNIGLTHKVEVLVQLAEILRDHDNIVFQIIGRGPRVPVLKSIVEEKSLPNCMFLPFQSDEMFPYSLSAANLGVVILDELTSKGSVPSKSYNLMSYGIPSLYIAGKDSELNNYAHKYNHAECFSEAELNDAAQFILKVSNDPAYWETLSENSVKASENFKRNNADKFVDLYLS